MPQPDALGGNTTQALRRLYYYPVNGIVDDVSFSIDLASPAQYSMYIKGEVGAPTINTTNYDFMITSGQSSSYTVYANDPKWKSSTFWWILLVAQNSMSYSITAVNGNIPTVLRNGQLLSATPTLPTGVTRYYRADVIAAQATGDLVFQVQQISGQVRVYLLNSVTIKPPFLPTTTGVIAVPNLANSKILMYQVKKEVIPSQPIWYIAVQAVNGSADYEIVYTTSPNVQISPGQSVLGLCNAAYGIGYYTIQLALSTASDVTFYVSPSRSADVSYDGKFNFFLSTDVGNQQPSAQSNTWASSVLSSNPFTFESPFVISKTDPKLVSCVAAGNNGVCTIYVAISCGVNDGTTGYYLEVAYGSSMIPMIGFFSQKPGTNITTNNNSPTYINYRIPVRIASSFQIAVEACKGSVVLYESKAPYPSLAQYDVKTTGELTFDSVGLGPLYETTLYASVTSQGNDGQLNDYNIYALSNYSATDFRPAVSQDSIQAVAGATATGQVSLSFALAAAPLRYSFNPTTLVDGYVRYSIYYTPDSMTSGTVLTTRCGLMSSALKYPTTYTQSMLMNMPTYDSSTNKVVLTLGGFSSSISYTFTVLVEGIPSPLVNPQWNWAWRTYHALNGVMPALIPLLPSSSSVPLPLATSTPIPTSTPPQTPTSTPPQTPTSTPEPTSTPPIVPTSTPPAEPTSTPPTEPTSTPPVIIVPTSTPPIAKDDDSSSAGGLSAMLIVFLIGGPIFLILTTAVIYLFFKNKRLSDELSVEMNEMSPTGMAARKNLPQINMADRGSYNVGGGKNWSRLVESTDDDLLTHGPIIGSYQPPQRGIL